MAMKKRMAASMAAIIVAAMCFGSTALAADENNTPVNGTGTASSVTDENTEVKMTLDTTAADPTWSVDIPQEISFNTISVNSPDSALEKPLKYSCAINNAVTDIQAQNEIKSLTVKLGDNKMFDMYKADEPTTKLTGVFGVVAEGSTDDAFVAANSKIVTMTPDKIQGEGKVKLDKTVLSASGVANGSYKGNLTVIIAPEKVGTPAS